MKTDYAYPENASREGTRVVKTWVHDGMQFTIIHVDNSWSSYYNGYVRFESQPVNEEGYGGILTYVPVHGGITFADEDKDRSMVYGFDCNHAHDKNNPKLRDIEWLGEECFRMGRAILVAAEFEQAYLSSADDEKAKVIQDYHDRLKNEGINFVLSDNFGAMIKVLSGSL